MGSSPIYSVTGEEVGFEGKHLGDFNPSTYWWYNSTGTVDIIIRNANDVLNYNIEALLIVLTNYEDFTTGSIYVFWSDNGSTWFSIVPDTYPFPLSGTLNGLRLIDFGQALAQNHQYFRIRISGHNTPVKASMVMALRKWTITQNSEYPLADKPTFNTRIQRGSGGRIFTTQYNTTSTHHIIRKYTFDGTTNKNALVNAHADCQGAFKPCILQEGSAYYNSKLVRFPDQLDIVEIGYQIYDANVIWTGLPLLPSGEYY